MLMKLQGQKSDFLFGCYSYLRKDEYFQIQCQHSLLLLRACEACELALASLLCLCSRFLLLLCLFFVKREGLCCGWARNKEKELFGLAFFFLNPSYSIQEKRNPTPPKKKTNGKRAEHVCSSIKLSSSNLAAATQYQLATSELANDKEPLWWDERQREFLHA